MSIQALDDGTARHACIYCDRAFGPVFRDTDEAHRFYVWLSRNPRKLTDVELETKVDEFREQDKEPGTV